MAIKVTSQSIPNPRSASLDVALTAVIDGNVAAKLYTEKALFEEIVEQLAAKYVEDNYAELVAGMSQVAVVNIALARAGESVAQSVFPTKKVDK
jgi:hypothetical protein